MAIIAEAIAPAKSGTGRSSNLAIQPRFPLLAEGIKKLGGFLEGRVAVTDYFTFDGFERVVAGDAFNPALREMLLMIREVEPNQ